MNYVESLSYENVQFWKSFIFHQKNTLVKLSRLMFVS